MNQSRTVALPDRTPPALVWVVCVVLTALTAAWAPFGLVVMAGTLAIVVWRWPRQATAIGAIGGFLLRPVLDTVQDAKILGVDPAAAFGALMLLVGGVLVARRLADRRRIWPDRLFGASQWMNVVLYTLLFFVGAVAYGGVGVQTGGREVARLFSALCAGLLLIWWCDEQAGSARGFRLLIAGSTVPILLGVYQAVADAGLHDETGYNRLFGASTHPNSYGVYLVPLTMIGIAGLVRLRGVWRGLAGGWTGLMVTLLVLTYSRTAVLVLAAAILVFVLPERRQLSISHSVKIAVMSVLATGAIWLLFGDAIAERFRGIAFDSAAVQQALMGQSQNSFQWRIINWAGLVQLGLQRPILGHGLGMTTVLNPLISPDSNVPFNAHDDFVRFFFEGGFVGLSLHLAQLLVFVAWLRRAARATPAPWSVEARAIAGALISLYLLSLGTTEMVENTAIIYQVFLLTGILIALRRRPTPADTTTPRAA